MDNRTTGFMNFENSTSLEFSIHKLFLVPIFIEFGSVLADLLKRMDF